MFSYLSTYKSVGLMVLLSFVGVSSSRCTEGGVGHSSEVVCSGRDTPVLAGKTSAPGTATLEGLVGTFPVKIRYVLNQLVEVHDALKSGLPLPQVFKNRLLLYGPPGNGKTTIARKIAENAGAHSIYKNTPELISKYQGQSAVTIEQIFNEAREHADLNNQPVVIIFDEIDTIASNVESEQRAEYLAALQELWHQLDLIQGDARLFFIGLTNKEELHPTLKTRFGNSIEKIGAPDASVRREVLQFYKKKYTGTPWNEKILKELVDNSANEKLNIRFLEDYVCEVYMVAKIEQKGVISDALARKIFYEMKTKYIENWTQWTKRLAYAHWDKALNVVLITAVRVFETVMISPVKVTSVALAK